MESLLLKELIEEWIFSDSASDLLPKMKKIGKNIIFKTPITMELIYLNLCNRNLLISIELYY